MPRFYKRVTNRPDISEENMEVAMNAVLMKELSIRKAAERYDIKPSTLQHRLEKKRKQDEDPITKRSFSNKFTNNQVFTADEEYELEIYIKKCSAIHHGLTLNQARTLAYDYASALPNCKYPEKWDEDKLAGLEWLKGFRFRHPSLSLRKPENTSAARASAFNKHTVDEFYNNYESVLSRYSFTPDNIYNLDESGVTTVQKTPKILAEKKQKQVGQIVSAERGQLVTFCAIVSATGSCIPPAFVFPRVNYKDHFINGSPEGSLGLATKSGWMTSEAFLKVLEHLKKYSHCSQEKPILLLFDNHESHASIDAVRYCKENGIILLSFPPHTSHRLQPLDVSVFGPFKAKLSIVFNNWHLNHPGRTLTIYDIPALVKIAYLEAFTMKNITSGFCKPGIWPFNRLAFSDSDFSAAYVTDRPNLSEHTVSSVLPQEPETSKSLPLASTSSENTAPSAITQKQEATGLLPISAHPESSEISPSTCTPKEQQAPGSLLPSLLSNLTANTGYPVTLQEQQTSRSLPSVVASKLSDETDPVIPQERQGVKDAGGPESLPLCQDMRIISPEIIRPFPKAPVRKQTTRGRQGKSRIYTDTPEKERLEMMEEEKRKKRAKAFLKKTQRHKKKKNARLLESSSESEDDIISLHSESDIDVFESDMESTQGTTTRSKEELSAVDINTNDFLLIRLGEKRCVHFVAQVLDKATVTEYEVSYLRKRQGFGKIMFTFPKEPDMAFADFTDVVLKLTPLDNGGSARRTQLYSFKEDLSSFKIE